MLGAFAHPVASTLLHVLWSCCIHLHTTANTYQSTPTRPKIVGSYCVHLYVAQVYREADNLRTGSQ